MKLGKQPVKVATLLIEGPQLKLMSSKSSSIVYVKSYRSTHQPNLMLSVCSIRVVDWNIQNLHVYNSTLHVHTI